jgi:rsbT co-antagonist protein RsbR
MAGSHPIHARALEISAQDAERRKQFVGLERSDLARIASIKDLVTRKADDFTEVFFDRLRSIPEAAPLFARADVLGEAKRLKRDHLIAMVGGTYDKAYVDQRLALGMLYGRVGLDVRVFLGAFHHLMRAVGAAVMQAGPDPAAAFESFMSLKKVGFFDIGIIVDVMIAER